MTSAPKEKIIKSKNRVRDQGEVFTQDREVKNILKLTQATSNIFWRFLEPACGDGNFLVEIVRQRLEHIKHNPNYRPKDKREFVIIHMISSIYGVDIAEDNIAECKKRIRDEIFDYTPKKSSAAFLLTLQNILDSNIQLGDMLNGKEKVYFVEYAFHGSEYLNRCKVKRRVYSLLDMERGDNKPVEELPAVSPADMKAIDLTEYHTVLDENINSEPDQIALFNTEQNNV
jgi:hypothetical protein